MLLSSAGPFWVKVRLVVGVAPLALSLVDMGGARQPTNGTCNQGLGGASFSKKRHCDVGGEGGLAT